MAGSSPEDWWRLDEVQQLLANLLDHPGLDHSEAVRAALRDHGGVLLDAHVHGLARALDDFVGGKHKRFTISRPVALHVWLFHLGGGDEAKLLPFPSTSAGAAAAASRATEKAVARAADAFFARRKKLNHLLQPSPPTRTLTPIPHFASGCMAAGLGHQKIPFGI